MCWPRCECWAQEISQSSNQEGTEMSQKKRPHQSHTEWVETQAPDNEGIQNWDPASHNRGATLGWACARVLSSTRTMTADACGKRNKTACTTAILHFHFGESGDPAIWFPLDQLRTWLELHSEEMEHRLGKIDVACAWAAAATRMRKKSRQSMVRGPMTATMATLHDLSMIPASPWKWYPR